MGKKITQLATITEVADDDLIVGVDVSDTSGSDNGTNKKFTKASLLDGLAPLDPQITGWNPLGEDLVYVSVDDPTGVVKVEGKDITDKLSVGMRLRFTNGGNVINAIITAITFSVDTTITFLHEIDPADSQALYLLTNSAITLPYFSSQKAPYGFPTSPAKWTVEITDNQLRSQLTATKNTWYNVGKTNCQITIPIGVWEVEYNVIATMTTGSSATYQKVTLSTANNGESNAQLTSGYYQSIASTQSPEVVHFRNKVLSITTKTTYYLNMVWTIGVAPVGLYFQNGNHRMTLRAVCAYL